MSASAISHAMPRPGSGVCAASAALPAGSSSTSVAAVFDLAGPGRGQPARSFVAGPDWAVLVEKAESGRMLTRRITTFRRVGRLYRRGEEVHRLRLHEPREV